MNEGLWYLQECFVSIRFDYINVKKPFRITAFTISMPWCDQYLLFLYSLWSLMIDGLSSSWGHGYSCLLSPVSIVNTHKINMYGPKHICIFQPFTWLFEWTCLFPKLFLSIYIPYLPPPTHHYYPFIPIKHTRKTGRMIVEKLISKRHASVGLAVQQMGIPRVTLIHPGKLTSTSSAIKKL